MRHFNENVIFLHLPKNGGSTFHTILEREYPKDKTFSIEVINNIRLNTDNFLGLSQEKKDDLKLLKGHMMYGLHKQFSSDFEYITFLRNPVDRILSFYFYVKSYPPHRLHHKVHKGGMSLIDFVTTINENDVNNCQVRWVSGIDDTPDNMLEKAIENIENNFAFVGFTERYDESLILLKLMYNWHIPYYKVVNKTSNRQSRKEVPMEVLKAIEELNGADVTLYEKYLEKFDDMIAQTSGIGIELNKLKLLNKYYNSRLRLRVESRFPKFKL